MTETTITLPLATEQRRVLARQLDPLASAVVDAGLRVTSTHKTSEEMIAAIDALDAAATAYREAMRDDVE